MKVVILAGGMGTRLEEETTVVPKPLVRIGDFPVLWHLMKIYSFHGLNDFIICLGYKGYLIKEYFSNYLLHNSDVTFDMSRDHMEVHQRSVEPWRVTLVDTGDATQTGGRLLRVKKYVEGGQFCFTYGDGLSNINLKQEIKFHRKHGKIATVAAVLPPGRYGALVRRGDCVTGFMEKPGGDGGWINGGFFVLSQAVFDHISGDDSSFEVNVLPDLAEAGQLVAFEHKGFWQPMDTLRDKKHLERLWESKQAAWKIW